MKVSNNIKKLDSSTILFGVGIIAITLVFVVIMIISIVNPSNITKIKQVKEVNISNYLDAGKNEEKYFIFVYASKEDSGLPTSTNELYFDIVCDYATRYINEEKKHDSHDHDHVHMYSIYRLDLSKSSNKNALDKLGIADSSKVPTLLEITYKDGSYAISSRTYNLSSFASKLK